MSDNKPIAQALAKFIADDTNVRLHPRVVDHIEVVLDAAFARGVEAAARVADVYQAMAIETATDAHPLLGKPWEERSIGAAHVAQDIRALAPADKGGGDNG